MTVQDSLADDIHRVWRQIRHAAHPSRRGDLTNEQLWLLAILRDGGPLSVSELARTLGVTQSAATTSCQRLERAGLVTRTRGVDDERVVRIAVTESGAAQVDAWQERQRDAVAPLLASMSPQESTELQRLLRKMLGATSDRPMIPALLWSIANVAESLV